MELYGSKMKLYGSKNGIKIYVPTPIKLNKGAKIDANQSVSKEAKLGRK